MQARKKLQAIPSENPSEAAHVGIEHSRGGSLPPEGNPPTRSLLNWSGEGSRRALHQHGAFGLELCWHLQTRWGNVGPEDGARPRVYRREGRSCVGQRGEQRECQEQKRRMVMHVAQIEIGASKAGSQRIVWAGLEAVVGANVIPFT